MGGASIGGVLWNQNLLPTTFIDSGRLQTTVTQETFESYGGSAGKMYRFTVTSPVSTYVVGCANGGNSRTLLIEVDQRVDRFFDTHSTQLSLVSQLDRRARILLACSAHRQ
jgi:hypothetical protein